MSKKNIKTGFQNFKQPTISNVVEQTPEISKYGFVPSSSQKNGFSPMIHNEVKDVLLDVAYKRFIELCELRSCTPKTIHTYEQVLAPFFKKIKKEKILYLGEITSHIIEQYILEIKNNVSPKSANRFLKYIKTFYSKLFKQGDISYICPAHLLEPLRVDKTKQLCLSDEELEKFFFSFDLNTFHGARNFTFFHLLLGSGLRVSEALNLEIDDICLNTNPLYIHVRRTKGKVDRSVPISSDLGDILSRYITQVRGEVPFGIKKVFINQNNTPMKYDAVKSILRRAAPQLNLVAGKKLTPHQFRRKFATEYIKQNKNIEKLRKILGHADVSTTQQYLLLTDADVLDDFDDETAVGTMLLRTTGRGR